MTTTTITEKWAVRVTLVDNTGKRESRRVFCEASPEYDPYSHNANEQNVCRLAFDMRKRFADGPFTGGSFEVEIIRTDVATTIHAGMRECPHHAAILDPKHGCAICNDIKMDPGWEARYPALAGLI